MDGNLLHIDLATLLCGNGDSGVGALCEDDSPGPLSVLLGAIGNSLGNLLDILGVKVVRLSKGSSLSLVTNEDIDVGEDLVERVLEELCDERSGQVENERLRQISQYSLSSRSSDLPCS